MAATEKIKEPARIQVTLAMPHNHAGQALKSGATIDVTPAQAQWLLQRGIINQTETN